ncbi:hypothetical protein [Fusibacter sp. 3D3]|uniref:hypothetical protein n=1 Tax=Fusibacter sp. 3D3 TaxID=1048380 RepID=UPI000852903F|nr:hypothetical protein [Fusibacter sp. 3D3]GAU79431.1 hypothetical protein F3D3_4095 [Fusibacter sp. 3D3]
MFKELEMEEMMTIEGGHYGYAEQFENSEQFPDAVNTAMACAGEIAYKEVIEPVYNNIKAKVEEVSEIFHKWY